MRVNSMSNSGLLSAAAGTAGTVRDVQVSSFFGRDSINFAHRRQARQPEPQRQEKPSAEPVSSATVVVDDSGPCRAAIIDQSDSQIVVSVDGEALTFSLRKDGSFILVGKKLGSRFTAVVN